MKQNILLLLSIYLCVALNQVSAQPEANFFVSHSLILSGSFVKASPFFHMRENTKLTFLYGQVKDEVGYLNRDGKDAVYQRDYEFWGEDKFELYVDSRDRLESIVHKDKRVTISYFENFVQYQWYSKTNQDSIFKLESTGKLLIDSLGMPEKYYVSHADSGLGPLARSYSSKMNRGGLIEVDEYLDNELISTHFFALKGDKVRSWATHEVYSGQFYQNLFIDEESISFVSLQPDIYAGIRSFIYKKMQRSPSNLGLDKYFIKNQDFSVNYGILKIEYE